jgi:outer membrane protein
MKKTLFAGAVVGALAFSFAAHAQTSPPWDLNTAPVGKAANTFMLRARAIGVIPLNSSSSVSTIGGTVSATAQAAPEVDLSYFLTDNIAFELIAASTRHNVSVHGSVLGSVDVGSVWVLPPTLTAQYHFFPHERFSPYLGVGLNVSWFYATQPANPPVTHWSMGNSVGAAIQAGFDYNFSGHWFANFDVKQIFLHSNASVDALGTTVKASTWLNPLVIGAGIGYRF